MKNAHLGRVQLFSFEEPWTFPRILLCLKGGWEWCMFWAVEEHHAIRKRYLGEKGFYMKKNLEGETKGASERRRMRAPGGSVLDTVHRSSTRVSSHSPWNGDANAVSASLTSAGCYQVTVSNPAAQRSALSLQRNATTGNTGDPRLFKLTQYIDSAALHRSQPTRRFCPDNDGRLCSLGLQSQSCVFS